VSTDLSDFSGVGQPGPRCGGFYREEFGDTLVADLVMMRRAELGRYEAALAAAPLADGQDVSDWEMREYFEFF
jgi:hypothetical protein